MKQKMKLEGWTKMCQFAARQPQTESVRKTASSEHRYLSSLMRYCTPNSCFSIKFY